MGKINWRSKSNQCVAIMGKIQNFLSSLQYNYQIVFQQENSIIIHHFTTHCELLEYRNTQKSVWRIWQHFWCLLDEGIPERWKKLNFHGGFLRADRTKTGQKCAPDGLNWLCYFAANSKSHHENSKGSLEKWARTSSSLLKPPRYLSALGFWNIEFEISSLKYRVWKIKFDELEFLSSLN